MKEGCEEALRETLAVSPALFITAYLSICLHIQPHKQKKKAKITKWLPASFAAQVEAGARKQNRSRDRESDLAVKFSAVLKDSFSALRLLPAAVRAAVRGPEPTGLLMGK